MGSQSRPLAAAGMLRSADIWGEKFTSISRDFEVLITYCFLYLLSILSYCFMHKFLWTYVVMGSLFWRTRHAEKWSKEHACVCWRLAENVQTNLFWLIQLKLRSWLPLFWIHWRDVGWNAQCPCGFRILRKLWSGHYSTLLPNS